MIFNPFGIRSPRFPMKGELSEVNTGDPLLYVKECMDGSIQAKYHPNLMDLLDKVFTYDGMKFLSKDQKRFMSAFFDQAGEATDRMNSNNAEPFKYMDDAFRQLDSFMGSYRGKDNGQYSKQA